MNYVRIWELHLALQCMICSNGFPHVFCRLWPIGIAAGHLKVLTRSCRMQISWLWPCEIESKGENFYNVIE